MYPQQYRIAKMFQPNTIRSLLSKRKSTRANTASSSSSAAKQQSNNSFNSTLQSGALDPDYESIIEVKLIKKQIQNKIENIRIWRQHQKQLLEQKMKSNERLNAQLNEQYMKNIQKQAEREQKQLKKILAKLNEPTEIKIEQNEEEYDSDRIFNVLTETDLMLEQLKRKNLQFKAHQQDEYLNMVSQMDQINNIFKKEPIKAQQDDKENNPSIVIIKGDKIQTESKKIDQELLKKQMEEIQNELRQIEELMADDDTETKKPTKKTNG